jgi:hypothetical protein
MHRTDARKLQVRPFEAQDQPAVAHLFSLYPYKNYQLNQLEIGKQNMVDFLSRSLLNEHVQNLCLWEAERMVGFISVKKLPWLSEYFEARMCTIQHFLGSAENPTHHEFMLKYVLHHLQDTNFCGCRVSGEDILAIHALENLGFRFVGSEVYMARSLENAYLSKDYVQSGCEACPEERLPEVIEIVKNNHFHNRYMYDPNIPSKKAMGIYKQFLSNCAFKGDYRLLIKQKEGVIDGFILYKFNSILSQMLGRKFASLDFIGVRHERKNAGVGVALNKGAVLDLARSGVSHIVVRTLASNYPAIRICHKVGFKLTSTDLHFHYWA